MGNEYEKIESTKINYWNEMTLATNVCGHNEASICGGA